MKNLYYGGILVVVGTHAWMLATGRMPQSQVRGHALINLAASAAIAASFTKAAGLLRAGR